MTRVLISKSTCPYCGIKLEKTPSWKSRCISCGKLMYVRTTIDRNRYLVTEDEVKRIKQEWAENTAIASKRPNHTEEEYEQLFQLPLRITIKKRQRNNLFGRTLGRPQEPVRWVLGSWCKAHCKRIAGYPSCTELEGEYDSWDNLPTVPSGQVACHSDEFWEWWDDHNDEQGKSWCDCHIEVFKGGVWKRGLLEE